MSRRYRQRGYQDDDRAEGGGEAARGARSEREGPRGRGLGRPTEEAFRCARCGERLAVAAEGIALQAVCSACGSDLHACTQCAWFDTSARFECRRPVVERIASKAKRNLCELFAPRLVSEHRRDEPAAPDDVRSAFDALFDL
ncbi:MAG: hypothetical protein R2991_13585 [Thermoanaerobaculia bacterium]